MASYPDVTFSCFVRDVLHVIILLREACVLVRTRAHEEIGMEEWKLRYVNMGGDGTIRKGSCAW